MSGYRVDDRGNGSYGETLLMRILPLVKNPSRDTLYDGSVNFKHVSNPILDTFIVSAADGSVDSVYRKEMPVAQECILTYCVKTLHSSYSWGQYEEVVDDTFINTTRIPYPWSTEPALESGTTTEYHGNISIYPPTEKRHGQGYGVSNETMMDTVFAFDQMFPSLITASNPEAKPFLKYRTSFTDKTAYRVFYFSPWLAPSNVTHHMERIATAMTNVARSYAGSNEMVAGEAFIPETYVEVKWPWLAFPLAMLALCIMFLVATMVKTSRGDLSIWKTSAMPTLMYSLPQDMRHNLTTDATWRSEESGGAKRVKIRLMPDQGWWVSGYMCTSPTLGRRNHPQAPPGWL